MDDHIRIGMPGQTRRAELDAAEHQGSGWIIRKTMDVITDARTRLHSVYHSLRTYEILGSRDLEVCWVTFHKLVSHAGRVDKRHLVRVGLFGAPVRFQEDFPLSALGGLHSYGLAAIHELVASRRGDTKRVHDGNCGGGRSRPCNAFDHACDHGLVDERSGSILNEHDISLRRLNGLSRTLLTVSPTLYHERCVRHIPGPVIGRNDKSNAFHQWMPREGVEGPLPKRLASERQRDLVRSESLAFTCSQYGCDNPHRP